MTTNRLALAICLAPAMTIYAPALAQERNFNIPSGSLKMALGAFVRQSGMQVIYRADEIRSARSAGARGRLAPSAALNALLAGSGFTARFDPSGAVAIVPASREVAAENDGAGEETDLTDRNEILVTGTRIKGAETASPTTTITAEQMRKEGRTDLGQVIRTISQNFNGGQNPGVLSSAGGTNISNQNVGGGSALNLRGLGPDATLTLLNGKRLTYSGFGNAIDVSAIPIAAIERFDVITDGASAIYGSDAVAGVANIILRRDFEGVTTSVRGNWLTRGGGEGYQASVTAGTSWQDGGVMLAYDRSKADPIFARQRPFVTGFDDPTAIYPGSLKNSFLLTGHQRLGSSVTIGLDALYARRNNSQLSAFPPYLYDTPVKTRTYTIAPSVEVHLSDDWSAKLAGAYGRDKNNTRYFIRDLATGDPQFDFAANYDNRMRSVELGFEGPLTRLPAGDIRIATGGGYRRSSFFGSGGTLYGGTEDTVFAYGELNVPVVSPAMDVAGIHRLNLTGALRYEKYDKISGTTTPKIGVVYEPTVDISLKASWGRSFKAASLLQKFIPGGGFLTRANRVGGSGYPADAVVVYVDGPNDRLKPERAETWTATLAFHPAAVPGLNLEASVFKINYTDRVQIPVNILGAALREPAYAPFVTYNPTRDQIAAALDYAGPGFTYNVSGDPYAAVAIINNAFANTASDRASGVDINGRYAFGAAGGDMVLMVSGSFLKGRRQLLEGGPTLKASGINFTPPRFRGRAGLTWDKDGFGVAAFLNHLGGIFANYNVVTPGRTRSFNTVEFNIRYALPAESGLLSGTEFALGIDNVLNTKPPLFEPAIDGIANYDSTNYSIIGRSIAFTVTKKW